MAQVSAYGQAQKEFFIGMLTRDISLIDCVLDLLDNCIDGANRELARRHLNPRAENRYRGFRAKIEFSSQGFRISDNCGGIPVVIASKYAFAFGRPDGAPSAKYSIGRYGIGMKRAVFKMGDQIAIESSTRHESFKTTIAVPAWANDDKNWNFTLMTGAGHNQAGTTITVTKLHSDVSMEFADAQFLADLKYSIARDYMFLIKKGFDVRVNNKQIKPLEVEFLSGNGYRPMRTRKTLRGLEGELVHLEVIAGLWKRSDAEDDDPDSNYVVEPGWYVVCNDRVILPADTTFKTGWEVEKYIEKKWHSQYRPFVGFALFSADEPNWLPLTTTKRGVDVNSAIYRQGLGLMAEATEPVIEYTNNRKISRVNAEATERVAPRVPILDLPHSSKHRFPSFTVTTKKLISVTYQVPETKLKKVKFSLGDIDMKHGAAGLATFDYYYRNVVEE